MQRKRKDDLADNYSNKPKSGTSLRADNELIRRSFERSVVLYKSRA
jgi:hypothetical protein